MVHVLPKCGLGTYACLETLVSVRSTAFQRKPATRRRRSGPIVRTHLLALPTMSEIDDNSGRFFSLGTSVKTPQATGSCQSFAAWRSKEGLYSSHPAPRLAFETFCALTTAPIPSPNYDSRRRQIWPSLRLTDMRSNSTLALFRVDTSFILNSQ